MTPLSKPPGHGHMVATNASLTRAHCLVRPLKVLYIALVLFCTFTRFKRAQIFALAGFRIYFSGVKPVFPTLEFPDHAKERAVIMPARPYFARTFTLRNHVSDE